MRERIPGIDRQRLLETLQRSNQSRFVAFVPEISSLEIQLVGSEIPRWNRHEPLAARPREMDTEGRHDRAGDLVLDREHVLQLAIVGVRPLLRVVACVDELRRNPQAIARLPHASFEDPADPQLRGDVWYVRRGALEGEGGRARRDAKALEPAQSIDQLLGHAVGENSLAGSALMFTNGSTAIAGVLLELC